MMIKAVHELVATLVFSTDPAQVMLGTKHGITVQVGWENRGEGRSGFHSWTTDASARWPARYAPPDYVQLD